MHVLVAKVSQSVFCGLFLRPVSDVHECLGSLWWYLKVATSQETVRQLDNCLSHSFGYFLGHLKPKKASGKAI